VVSIERVVSRRRGPVALYVAADPASGPQDCAPLPRQRRKASSRRRAFRRLSPRVSWGCFPAASPGGPHGTQAVCSADEMGQEVVESVGFAAASATEKRA
jgi:hypothetical protein